MAAVIVLALAIVVVMRLSKPRLPPVRNDATAVSGFLERTRERQAIRERVLIRRGRQKALRGMERLVATTPLEAPGGQRPLSDALRQDLLQSLQTDVAQELVVLGFTPAGIAYMRARGLDPVGAMLRVIRGGATFDDFALLADHIVIAHSTGHDDAADLGDGFHSSEFVQVDAVLKGNNKVGDVLAVRQQSGRQPDGSFVSVSSELGPLHGTHLLMLSTERYQQLALEKGRKPSPGRNVLDYGPNHLVAQDGSLQRSTLQVSPTTLREAQTRIARLQGVPGQGAE
ncbi:MAG: hypothetical protein WKF61_10655 [Luteimonas sp.]